MPCCTICLGGFLKPLEIPLIKLDMSQVYIQSVHTSIHRRIISNHYNLYNCSHMHVFYLRNHSHALPCMQNYCSNNTNSYVIAYTKRRLPMLIMVVKCSKNLAIQLHCKISTRIIKRIIFH